jgi:hypothetical protein
MRNSSDREDLSETVFSADTSNVVVFKDMRHGFNLFRLHGAPGASPGYP